MARTFCTGPIHVGIGWGDDVTAVPPKNKYYYGTTQKGPDIQEETKYFNVMNDLSGPELPLDRGYAGAQHTVTLEMTRWDGSVDYALDKYPFPAALGALTGTEAANERGSLVSRIGNIQILMLVSNGGIVAPADSTMIRWRWYHQLVPVGPHQPIMGNKENVRLRKFVAQNIFLGIDINDLTKAMFRLFTEATGALPWTFTIT